MIDRVVTSAEARRPRVHYHTDHSWFAGCETMLVNLLSSVPLKSEFDVSMSYRASPRYEAGLRERVRIDFPVYPLDFRTPSELFVRGGESRAPLHRMGRAVSRQLSTLPLLAYEVELLRRLLVRVRPDVLHINNGGYPGALSARAAAIAGRLAGVPHVVMVVNNLAEDYVSVGRWGSYWIDRLVAGSTERFLAGSSAAAARVSRVLRLAPGEARGLPNGADLRRPSETVRETRARLGLQDYAGVVFGIVGLLEHRKGHHVLLDAMSRMVRERSLGPEQVHLLLLGGGPLRASIERMAADLGLAPYCRFLGEESNAMNVISILDVLVLSSVAHEDFPNVVIEAMGAGKAVIASRIAGTPEQVVDGETGCLVPAGDAAALAAAMGALCADPPRRTAMGAAGRRRYEAQFTAPASVERYVHVYRELLGERP